MLAALRDAGVVDAGGYGLTIIFAGVVAALQGQDPPPLDHHAPARITHPQHSSGTYRFCTNFAVTGAGLSPASHVDALEALGDSVLVVGDESTLKVHLHTDAPERATALFDGVGDVSRLDVADMRAQVAERDERIGAPVGASAAAGANGAASGTSGRAAQDAADVITGDRCGAVAVVSGDGLREMFAELGVPHDRRRADAQPLHLRPARGDPRRARRGGRGAAEQRQRVHGGRARGQALRQAGPRRAHDQPAGRSRGCGRARTGAFRRAERPGADRSPRRRAHRRGRARRTRRRTGTVLARRSGGLRGR